MVRSNEMNLREEYLQCDACGQRASPEHIARRLRRLEWATRYRPVHIQTLLLGGVAPREDAEFLYAPGKGGSAPSGGFDGEAGLLLRALGISAGGKAPEAVHTEFRGAGLFLTHILECPLEDGQDSGAEAVDLLRKHLPAVASRIRRSLKPKRVTLVTELPQRIIEDILSMDLGCPIVLDNGKPFRFTSTSDETSFSRFRQLLAGAPGS